MKKLYKTFEQDTVYSELVLIWKIPRLSVRAGGTQRGKMNWGSEGLEWVAFQRIQNFFTWVWFLLTVLVSLKRTWPLQAALWPLVPGIFLVKERIVS